VIRRAVTAVLIAEPTPPIEAVLENALVAIGSGITDGDVATEAAGLVRVSEYDNIILGVGEDRAASVGIAVGLDLGDFDAK
jgi:hypothetical protein